MCFIFPLISFWERRRTAPLKAKSLNPRETFFYSPIQLRWLSGKNRKEEKDKKELFGPSDEETNVNVARTCVYRS